MPTFETETGRPVPAVTTEQMREVDRVAVQEVDLGLLQMMENAGRTLAGFARDLTDGRVVVLAGTGGNGGGGLCAARHLANHGHGVSVVLDRSPENLTGAAARQYRILGATDVPLTTDLDLESGALLVDALVGYGLSGPLSGRVASLVEAATDHPAPVLSLDVPSGVDATTGDRPGRAISPAHVLTLALPKAGLAGVADLWLADIGLPSGVFERAGVEYSQPFDGRGRVRLRTA
jgi:NAD(P)H-hydrate epimerase